MRILFILLCGFILTSFHAADSLAKYELTFEAKGCHYQISVNDKLLIEGKSYQMVTKNININDKLANSGQQKIDIKMIRISREIPLKTTQAFVNLKLEKTSGDSTILIKEVKLPTFPYDDDESQPQSIGGAIEFDIADREK